MEHPRPDDKNWTWVLERPCPACRFDAGTIARHVIGATVRTTVEAWREVLRRGALVRQRPPGPAARGPIWSALEYGCHVRDVFVLFEERLRLMLTQGEPTFANWDQDATAIAQRYWRTIRRPCARPWWWRESSSPPPLTACATTSGSGPGRAPTARASPSNRLGATFCTTPSTTCRMWPRDSRHSPGARRGDRGCPRRRGCNGSLKR